MNHGENTMNNIIKTILAVGATAMAYDAWQKRSGSNNIGSLNVTDAYWALSREDKFQVISKLLEGMKKNRSNSARPTILVNSGIIENKNMRVSELLPLLDIEQMQDDDFLGNPRLATMTENQLVDFLHRIFTYTEVSSQFYEEYISPYIRDTPPASPLFQQGTSQQQGKGTSQQQAKSTSQQQGSDAALRAQYEALFSRKPLSAQQESRISADAQFGFGRTLGPARSPLSAQQQKSATTDSDFGFKVSGTRAPLSAKQQKSATSDSEFGFTVTGTRAPLSAQQQKSATTDSDFGFTVSGARSPLSAQQQKSATSDSDFGFDPLTVPTFEQFKKNPGKYRR